MSSIIIKILSEFWLVLSEMSPYLLFGFFMAGLLSIFISPETVERHLGGKGIIPIIKAAVFGVPLPLCSCGVIPVSASLRRHGANRSATTAFLISTPQTGVDSILVTYSLLGGIFAILRPIAAFITGLFGGFLVQIFDKNHNGQNTPKTRCEAECCTDEKKHSKIYHLFHYGFVTLPQDIAQALIVGLVVAAGIAVALPDDFLAGTLVGGGMVAMLIMMVIGIPVYVCATASVPIAAVFIAKGISPGAALVFLMTGPATNAATITTVWKILGKRTAIVYLITIALGALISGLTLDYIFQFKGINHHHIAHWMLPSYVGDISAVILLLVLVYAIYRYYYPLPPVVEVKPQEIREKMKQVTLKIEGMTCNHCVVSVRRALLETKGVISAEVELKGGTALVSGDGFELESLKKAVETIGYKVVAK